MSGEVITEVRDRYPYLSDEEWNVLPVLHALLGTPQMEEFLQSSTPEQIKEILHRYLVYTESLIRNLRVPRQAAIDGAVPMDLDSIEQCKLDSKCFNCGHFEPFAKDCPTPEVKDSKAAKGGKRGWWGRKHRPNHNGSRASGNAQAQLAWDSLLWMQWIRVRQVIPP